MKSTVESEVTKRIPSDRPETTRAYLVRRVCEIVGVEPESDYGRLPQKKRRAVDLKLKEIPGIFDASQALK